LKIAVSGKGGVGKTTISGTLARIYSSKGRKVIAVDADPSMNLHTSIGASNPEPISRLKELIKERTVIGGGMYNMNPKVEDIPERFSSTKENVRLIVMGTVEKGGSGCICPESTFLRSLLRHLVLEREEVLVLDTEAGLEHLGRRVAEKFDLMLVLSEPSLKAIETANRIGELSKQIGVRCIYAVGNKVSSRDQEEVLSENLELELAGFIPADGAVQEADIRGVPLYEHDSDSTALKAIEGISDKLLG